MTSEHRRLPRLPYLALAHHYKDRLNRTFKLRLFGWEQHFCTRCTAQWASVGVFAPALLLSGVKVGLLAWVSVLFLLPLPALADWITQSWGFRESTTAIRLVTGSALGIGYGLELQAVVDLDVTKIVLGIAIYCLYMLTLLVLLKIRPFPSGVVD